MTSEVNSNTQALGLEAPQLTHDGVTFRDLNKNGRLDPYEDPRRPLAERVEDLLAQMTLEEKAGLMFHTMLAMNPDGSLIEQPSPFMPMTTTEMVVGRQMNHFESFHRQDAKNAKIS